MITNDFFFIFIIFYFSLLNSTLLNLLYGKQSMMMHHHLFYFFCDIWPYVFFFISLGFVLIRSQHVLLQLIYSDLDDFVRKGRTREEHRRLLSHAERIQHISDYPAAPLMLLLGLVAASLVRSFTLLCTILKRCNCCNIFSTC